MRWIYLSPHLDDVIWSCGGLIWEQKQQGVSSSIWTIFTGDPGEGELSLFAQILHQRWGIPENSVLQRRLEDERACARLSVEFRHFMFQDCIYRKAPVYFDVAGSESLSGEGYLYPTREAIFGDVHPSEADFFMEISRQISQLLNKEDVLISPLVIGNHVDHQLTRKAAEHCGKVEWYYADFPYVQEEAHHVFQTLRNEGWRAHCFPISDEGLKVWKEAAAAYTSQIGIFWEDVAQMEYELERYRDLNGGILLWKPPQTT